jgi:hypothetical protein
MAAWAALEWAVSMAALAASMAAWAAAATFIADH